MNYRVRKLQADDNQAIAGVIRKVLEEHDMDRPGTVYTDSTTDDLFRLFQAANSTYFVVEMDQKIAGGCGVYPTDGLPEGCAELVKLYLLPAARGKGIGKMLLDRCAEEAKSMGYDRLYLESMPELSKAVGLYESVGYKKIDAPLGNSGHFACNLWMLQDLTTT